MVLNPDFKEFFRLLNEHEVRYLIVGGYAVAYHGHPRYTKDIDVWVLYGWADGSLCDKSLSAGWVYAILPVQLNR